MIHLASKNGLTLKTGLGFIQGQGHSNTMSASFLADQRKIIFYKQTICSGNIVLNTICSLYHNDIRKICSSYNVTLSFEYCLHQTDNVVSFFAFDS